MPKIMSQHMAAALEQAARILESGGLVVAPTETRYGLLARVDSESAVSRLYTVKGRPSNTPTALFVRCIDEVNHYGQVTPSALRLIKKFLPGPLTLVLQSKTDWSEPRVVDGKIGFRWSPSPFISALLEKTAVPLTATSANRSGKPNHFKIEEIAAEFGNEIELYIDGGLLTGPTSTVVECIGDSVRVLRDGAIPVSEIERFLRS